MEIDTTTVLVVSALQLVQTAQLWLLNRGQRRLSRTLMPPPLAVPPPPLRAAGAYCNNCGNLTSPAELRGGLCPECLGTNPTDRPYDDPHADVFRRRRRGK